MNDKNGHKDTHLTVNEIADIYRKKPATIRKWARESKIPGQRIGKNWLFNKKHIHADLAEIFALEHLGPSVSRQTRMAPFDLLCGGDKIDVKSSQLRNYSGKKHWSFVVDFSTKKQGGEYCDFLFLVCYDIVHKRVLRAYFPPLAFAVKNFRKGEYNRLTITIYKHQKTILEPFRIGKLDIPAYLREDK